MRFSTLILAMLLVMVHGKNRDADHYYSTAMAAAFLAHAMADTVVVATFMTSSHPACGDPVTPPQLDFSCVGDSWRAGAAAVNEPHLTSFDFVEAILRKTAPAACSPICAALWWPAIRPAGSSPCAMR